MRLYDDKCNNCWQMGYLVMRMGTTKYRTAPYYNTDPVVYAFTTGFYFYI